MTNIISKISTIVAGSLLALLVFAQSSYADEISIDYDLQGFEHIRLDNVGISLDVSVGEDFDITVEGEEDVVNSLLLKVRGKKLVIYRDDDKKFWDRNNHDGPQVTISMPKFSGFDLRGAVDANIEGIDSDEVEFDLKGAGNIELSGKCRWLIVDLKGAGNVEADDLKCEEVDVDLKGAGNIEVYASEKVNAEIKGMGNIDVYGDPKDVTKSDGWLSHITIH